MYEEEQRENCGRKNWNPICLEKQEICDIVAPEYSLCGDEEIT